MDSKCRICGETQRAQSFVVREMLLGIGDEHLYSECGQCGTIQIEDPPEEMGRYYGERYFRLNESSPDLFPGWALSMDLTVISRYLPLPGQGTSPTPPAPTNPHWKVARQEIASRAVGFYLPELAQRPEWKVLDVGCASGAFISVLRDIGFDGVYGVDPHVDSDVVHSNGAVVRKGTLEGETRTWDVIMFNHSFEHIADPLTTLSTVVKLLNPEGMCLIRIPKVPNEAWKAYGPNWVQLDAPRHFFIHHADTLVRNAAHAGLRHIRTVDDSGILQFTGSEQYAAGLSYSDRTPTTLEEMTRDRSRLRRLAMKAVSLNRRGLGDQAAFVFRRA